MSAVRSLGLAFCIPLFGTLGYTAYTSRNIRKVFLTDPLTISPYCRNTAEKTRQENIPCLMCAFEVPAVLPNANVRDEITQYHSKASLYAIHALLSCFFIRTEVITSAFLERWRLSDAYNCWNSTRRYVLSEQRSAIQQNCTSDSNIVDNTCIQLNYGQWEAELLPIQKEAVLLYNSEAIVVSLEPVGEGTRQAVLRICYIIQPFEGFIKGSIAERIALWCVEKYVKLLTAQAAYSLERLGK